LTEDLSSLRGQNEAMLQFLSHPQAKSDSKEVIESLKLWTQSLMSSQADITRKIMQNRDLRKAAIDHANKMREFEHKYKSDDILISMSEMGSVRSANKEDRDRIWNDYTQKLIRRSNDYAFAFRKNFLGEAIWLRDELLKRLPPQPQQEKHKLIAFDGFLAGPSPVGDAADYLEILARQLSD
jgi:hypothetical protein